MVALDALPGWIESSSPSPRVTGKAKGIPVRIVVFARIVPKLVVSPAGDRASGEVPLCRRD